MSETARPSAIPSVGPARQPTGPPASGSADGGGEPAPLRPAGVPPPSGSLTPRERLVTLGVAESTARALEQRYGTSRVVDALDAVDTLGAGEVRRRAGWVVSAIRQGWDLEGLLAERRQLEARYARWERERVDRGRAAARWRAAESVAGGWRAAVSSALDDRLLAVAVERATAPVAGLGRRSVPIVRAQLLAWAVSAHIAAPDRPLSEVLADDLVGGDRTVVAPPLDGPLPPVPGQLVEAEDDLTDRLTRLLARRPDLSQPDVPARERADGARGRAVGEGIGHGR